MIVDQTWTRLLLLLRAWSYLNDTVHVQNHLCPLHRVHRVLLQAALLLLQQALKHRGDLGHLATGGTLKQVLTYFTCTSLRSDTHLPEEDVCGREAGRHGSAALL